MLSFSFQVILILSIQKLLFCPAFGKSNRTSVYKFCFPTKIYIETLVTGSLTLLSFYNPMAALAGNYVNFGVFELYGDRALADALDIALKMTLSIPLADILAYRKVCGLLYFSCQIFLLLVVDCFLSLLEDMHACWYDIILVFYIFSFLFSLGAFLGYNDRYFSIFFVPLKVIIKL